MKSAKRNILRRFCLYTNSPLNNSLFANVAFFKIIPIFVAIYPKEKTMKSTIRSIWNFYADGFRQMTWGPQGQNFVDLSECVRQLVILQEPQAPVKNPDEDFIFVTNKPADEEPQTDPRWDKLKALKSKMENRS